MKYICFTTGASLGLAVMAVTLLRGNELGFPGMMAVIAGGGVSLVLVAQALVWHERETKKNGK